MIPGKYPLAPESKLLVNDGTGMFTEVTNALAPGLKSIGMVTDAVWIDLNNDNRNDLIVVGEWLPIKVFINSGNKFVDQSSSYINFASK